MAYSDSFSVQWDRFVLEFTKYIQGQTAEMISIGRLNDWYKSNSFRWSSIAENEGILLSHENNDNLRNALLEELPKFTFSEIELPQQPKVLPYLTVGALLAVGFGSTFKFLLHQNILMTVIGAIAGILVPVVIYAKHLDNCNSKQRKMILEGYSGQLVAYKEHLLAICKMFESNQES